MPSLVAQWMCCVLLVPIEGLELEDESLVKDMVPMEASGTGTMDLALEEARQAPP